MQPNGDRQFAFFGDSFTDPGNLYAITEGLITDVYRDGVSGFGGRVSDGPVYAEYVASIQGLPESLNYAVAGAEAIGSQTLRDFVVESAAQAALLVDIDDPALDWDMNLDAQVARFAAETVGEDRSGIQGFIFIGGNDYGEIDITDPQGALVELAGTMLETIDATLDAVWELTSLGCDTVTVSGLPSAGFMPSLLELGASLVGEIDDLIDQHNSLLQDGIDFLRLLGRDILYYDMQAITDAFVDDPTQFGILAPWDQTLREDPVALAAYDASQVGFWDSLHPSGATHGVLGGWLAHAASGETLSGLGDTVSLGGGDKVVLAYAGNDDVTTLGGDDTVFLGSGADTARLGAGNDIGSGGAGDDVLKGGSGNDILVGGIGNDLSNGGAGKDVLIDGIGDDILQGRRHDDVFVFFEDTFLGGADAGRNKMFGGGGSDRLVLVLSETGADAYDAAANREQALDTLGIAAKGIETVDVVIGRDGLEAALGGETWFAEVNDIWNLI